MPPAPAREESVCPKLNVPIGPIFAGEFTCVENAGTVPERRIFYAVMQGISYSP
jgi:hypothetical protein